MGLAVLITAITAGLVGAGCSHLLHIIEGLVFGDASGTLLHAISSVPWWHRIFALGGAGLVGGISWYLYARVGGKPVSLPKAVNGQKMPILLTFWHSINQIVIVGMGASIGREVAPREISASLGGKIADFLYLPPEQRRIIVGCAAGAGLAAVYSLPLSGAVFALEILLIEVTASAVWPALIISGGAVLVAHGWVRSDPFYTLPEATQLLPTASLTLWAVIIGPLLGIIGVLFKSAVAACSAARPTGWRLLAWMIPTFTLIGVITVWVPSIAGNGQSTAQLAFDGAVLGQGGRAAAGIGVVLLASLAIDGFTKLIGTLATIRSGAWGGTLTPGLALGASSGAILGILWSYIYPGDTTAIVCFAFIGAVVVLGTSMSAPLTALCLVIEFTHRGATLLVPTVIALGLGVGAARMWNKWRAMETQQRKSS
mgnify:FL=1